MSRKEKTMFDTVYSIVCKVCGILCISSILIIDCKYAIKFYELLAYTSVTQIVIGKVLVTVWGLLTICLLRVVRRRYGLMKISGLIWTYSLVAMLFFAVYTGIFLSIAWLTML